MRQEPLTKQRNFIKNFNQKHLVQQFALKYYECVHELSKMKLFFFCYEEVRRPQMNQQNVLHLLINCK